MTNIGSLLLFIVCIGIGYVFEPIFFSDTKPSTSATAPSSEDEVAGEGAEADSDDASGMPGQPDKPGTSMDVPKKPGSGVDLSQITQADYPSKVTLKLPYTLEDEESGATMHLKAGSKVKPIRLDGDQLVFKLGGLPIEGKTNVENTDFKVLALPMMLKRLQDAAVAQNSSETATDPPVAPDMGSSPKEPAPPIADADTKPVVKPDVQPDTQPAADGKTDTKTAGGIDGKSAEKPGGEPGEEPVAEKSTPKEPAAGGALDGPKVIALMKASVKAGDVTEFETSQVVSWRAGDDMEFDGKTYQVGLVTFSAETILGMQQHEAIALIENGKVSQWMWATTKLEMR